MKPKCIGAFATFSTFSKDKHRSCCNHNHGNISNDFDWQNNDLMSMRRGLLGVEPLHRDCSECIKSGSNIYDYYQGSEFDDYISENSSLFSPDGIYKGNPITYNISTSRRCELACMTCTEVLSSGVVKLRKRIGFKNALEDNDPHESEFDNVAFINKYGESLKQITFVGGEPLLNPDFSEVIEAIINNNIPDVNIYTNAMPKKVNGKSFIELMDGIPNVSVTCSIDGTKVTSEYLRVYSNFNKQDKFIKEIAQSNIKNTFISTCVSNVAVLRFDEFIDYFVSEYQPLGIKLNLVFPTAFTTFSAYVLPKKVKTNMLMKLNASRFKHRNNTEVLEAISKVIRMMLTEPSEYDREQNWLYFCAICKHYDETLNRTPIYEVFPELKEYMDYTKYPIKNRSLIYTDTE